jgi:carbamoyl-phosphate synthase large subunit
VLITSSSAKVLLIKNFAESVNKYNGNVFTGDSEEYVASSFFSKKHFKLPPTTNTEDFSNTLEYLCKKYDISLVIPTRDGELEVMSEIKEKFANYGITILVPDEQNVNICLNKKKFSNVLLDNGFNPIPIIRDFTVNPPYFIRPVYGSASSGVKIANTHEEAMLFMNNDFLVHPFIDADEFSIDLLMSIDGKTAIQSVCRQRIKVIGGESKISKVVNIPILERICMEIGELLNLVGHNTLQAFYTENLGVIMIEANARFGGSSNLSISAGLDSPNRIVKMLMGDKSAYKKNNINYGLTMYRYSEDVII